MAKHLFLLETRARYTYKCAACEAIIFTGSRYFRHDPYPHARWYRGEKASQWCYDCVTALGVAKDPFSGRIRVPVVRVLPASRGVRPTLALARVDIVGVGRRWAERLASDPALLHSLTPEQFEELVCDCLNAMGYEPRQVWSTYQRDGGIDIVFWSRRMAPIPILGAAQVKHHRKPSTSEGVSTVRDLAGTIAGHPFNVGLLITNTSFTPDAEWLARERARLLRLRGFEDIRRWLTDNFSDDEEWRELPESIEICPGVIVPIRRGQVRF